MLGQEMILGIKATHSKHRTGGICTPCAPVSAVTLDFLPPTLSELLLGTPFISISLQTPWKWKNGTTPGRPEKKMGHRQVSVEQ